MSGPCVSLGRLGPGLCPIGAITLRIGPFVRLIRPLPLEIDRFLEVRSARSRSYCKVASTAS
jgi:hypothetical protein